MIKSQLAGTEVSVSKGAEALYHKESMFIYIKPTNRCNGECIYCSSQKETPYRDMTEDVLEKIFDELVIYCREAGIRHVSIAWHGGEPLLMGRKFYTRAFEVLEQIKDVHFQQLLQSNVLLLDREWIDLFTEHGVHVSTSLDPIFPEMRIYKNGRPQHPDWLDRFSLLCKSGGNRGAVFTVSPDHADRARDIYTYFKNIQHLSPKGVSFELNPVYRSGRVLEDMEHDVAINPKDYGRFLVEFFTLWDADGRLFTVSPFKGWINGVHLKCGMSGDCHEHFMGIDGEGNVFNCGRFLDIGLKLGNIYEEMLTEIVRNEQRTVLYERRESLQESECGECRYWRFCRGDCPFLSYVYYDNCLKPSPFCEAYKIFSAYPQSLSCQF